MKYSIFIFLVMTMIFLVGVIRCKYVIFQETLIGALVLQLNQTLNSKTEFKHKNNPIRLSKWIVLNATWRFENLKNPVQQFSYLDFPNRIFLRTYLSISLANVNKLTCCKEVYSFKKVGYWGWMRQRDRELNFPTKQKHMFLYSGWMIRHFLNLKTYIYIYCFLLKLW